MGWIKNVNNAVKIHKQLQVINKSESTESQEVGSAIKTIQDLGKQFDGHKFNRMQRVVFFFKTGTFISRDFNKAQKKFVSEGNKTLQVARRAIFGEQTFEEAKAAVEELQKSVAPLKLTSFADSDPVKAIKKEVQRVISHLKELSALSLSGEYSEKPTTYTVCYSTIDVTTYYIAYETKDKRLFRRNHRDLILEHFASNRSKAALKELLLRLRSIENPRKEGTSLVDDETVIKYAHNRLSNAEIAGICNVKPIIKFDDSGQLVGIKKLD